MYNRMEFKKININTFINEHKHVYYCEAIIYPDGDITYAVPSHQQSLISITEKDMNYLMDIMPISAAPTEWLIDYTGCIAVWFEGFMVPNGSELFFREEEEKFIYLTKSEKMERYKYKCSKKQLESLQKLIDNKIIKNYSLRN